MAQAVSCDRGQLLSHRGRRLLDNSLLRPRWDNTCLSYFLIEVFLKFCIQVFLLSSPISVFLMT